MFIVQVKLPTTRWHQVGPVHKYKYQAEAFVSKALNVKPFNKLSVRIEARRIT